ncbi:hypothetical protein K1719_035954 [Acacia pycnantha]|nr:hypothetical protein K1719_035954 [Acacia pycnantha]
MKKGRVSLGMVVMLLMALLIMAKGGEEEAVWRICREELGLCGSQEECAMRCAADHPGGQGACKYPPGPFPLSKNYCICKYPC